MKHGLAAAATLLALCAGCANLNTNSRTTTLPLEGKAMHLQAAQRLAYTDSAGRICAEPVPDTTSPTGIGQTTQQVTLLRDTLYRICEASHNGVLAKGDAARLIERTQDVTLGLLAIEQLTGVFGADGGRRMDKDSAAQIAEATKYIVATIVLKDHLTDTCISLMTGYAAEADQAKREVLRPMFEQCQEVIKAYLTKYSEVVTQGTRLVAPAPPPAAPNLQLLPLPVRK